MKYRIATWVIAGFVVAGFWALFAWVTFPYTNERMQEVWIFVSITCPIAIVGKHHPITLYEALAANAVMYGIFGLVAENSMKHLLHLHKVQPHS